MGGEGGGSVAQCTRGTQTQRDTVTFTCLAEEHSGVVTLFLKIRCESTRRVHRSALHSAASCRRSRRKTPALTALISLFNPATTPTQAHLRLAALEVEQTGRSLHHSSPSFVLSFCCGDVGSEKGNRLCSCLLLSTFRLWSLLTRQAHTVVIYIVL